MQIKKLGRRAYEVTLDLSGYTWQFSLSGGGLFSNEEKALNAAQGLAVTSHACLQIAAMINDAMSHYENMPLNCRNQTRQENRRIWLTQARDFSELALAVPDRFKGFSTGSNGIDEVNFIKLYHMAKAFEDHIIRMAPVSGSPDDMNDFLSRWCANLTRSAEVGKRLYMLRVLNNTYTFNRSQNTPALCSKSPDSDERILRGVHRAITAHIPDFLPVVSERRPIRGDRAASLLNVMVPEIERKLEAVADPVERARLQERLGKLVSRVEVASANKDEKRALQDAILTIETLEESVESRLTASETGPTF